jgi:hypothetical protein
MFKTLQVTAVVLCLISNLAAATVSIGTISARGDIRVDNYSVKGNATLFDGSVVETSQASADLRLNKGVEITMSAASRGTLYSDHLVLQQGQSEVTSSGSYQLQAVGLNIVPSGPHARGVVSVKSANTVEVASLDGTLGVSNGQGIVLANILPGRSLTFAMQAGANPAEFSGIGVVSFENGTYYLITDGNVKYVLSCKDPHSLVGDKVVVTGTLQGAASAGSGGMICVKTMDINGPSSMGSKTKWIIAGAAIAAAGAGAVIASERLSLFVAASVINDDQLVRLRIECGNGT